QSSASPPIALAPIVERRGVGWGKRPNIGARPGLDVIYSLVDRAPRGITPVCRRRWPAIPHEPQLARAHALEALLRFEQRRVVGATRHGGGSELHVVVLPVADGTDVKGSGWLGEYDVPATRTGEFGDRGHLSEQRNIGVMLPIVAARKQREQRRDRGYLHEGLTDPRLVAALPVLVEVEIR